MKKTDFNQNWTVQKDGESHMRKVNLPHDAMLFEKRSKDSALAGAGGYFHGGKYIYRKNFFVPDEWREKTVILECEAVYHNALVLVNGQNAATHPYGYTQFFVDLDNFLEYGRENEIQIIADNTNVPNSRWYSGSGVYREVHLYLGGKSFIHPEGVKVKIIDGQNIEVNVEASGEANVIIEIMDGDKVVAKANGNKQTLHIADAKLWDEDNPHLYQCHVALSKNGLIIDEAATSFGIRTLTWNEAGQAGFFVNGHSVLLRGACVHHDNGILGGCSFRDAEWRRVRILKEAGFNAIRSSHNPASKAMLDACDALGVYMIDEAFDMWLIQKNPHDYGNKTFKQWWKNDVAAMISKDYNHPSVIMYSIGNEISELGLPEGQAMCREMTEYVRGLDNGRAVTLGINLMLATMAGKGKGLYGKDRDGNDKKTGSMAMDQTPTSTAFNILMNRMCGIIDRMSASPSADRHTNAIAPLLDIPGYNYATSRYRKEQRMNPGRAFVGSETLPKYLYRNWQLVEKLPALIGDFMWTGWDYLGEAGLGTVRYQNRKTKQDAHAGLIISGGAGIIDICGKKRPEVGWGKLIWNLDTKPVIGVNPLTQAAHFKAVSMWRNTDAVESWSWEGYEGVKTGIVVYADSNKVELILNGRSLGKKRVKEAKAFFTNIAYEPGTLEALAFDDTGAIISSAKLVSATGPTEIALRLDRTVLKANGQDLCFVDIDLVGDNGVTKSSVDMPLHVSVEGSGTLQAFGSARPNMVEDFVSDCHTTYYGKALAVVRSGHEPGEICLLVSGEGIAKKEVVIRVG